MAAETEQRRVGALFRASGLSPVVGFVGLLTYGLFAPAPDTTVDEALAKARAVPAAGFELAVLTDGDPGERLHPAWRGAAADDRVETLGRDRYSRDLLISARGEVVGHVIGTLTADQLDADAGAARAGRPQSTRRGGEQRPAG